MEKLLELLNEYHHFNSDLIYYGWDEEYKKVYFHTELPEEQKKKLAKAGIEDEGIDEQRVDNEWICSKQFGFIEWLVENDKIDFEKYRIMDTRKYLHQHIIGNTCYVDIRADVPNYEFILALLSIQDEPIEFLISILK